jgi:hypothetical protein
MTDKTELLKALKQHDWCYHYSDDHRVYERGRRESEQIRSLVKALGEEGSRIFSNYIRSKGL